MSLLTASAFLFLLLALSAFVSGAEIAIAASRKIKLQVMAKYARSMSCICKNIPAALLR